MSEIVSSCHQAPIGPMSQLGHKRKWSPANSESGLPSGTDIQHSAYDFRFVPGAEIESDFTRTWMSCSLRGLRVRRVQVRESFACRKRSGRDTLRVVALEEHYCSWNSQSHRPRRHPPPRFSRA
jgi:hypothetical protein